MTIRTRPAAHASGRFHRRAFDSRAIVVGLLLLATPLVAFVLIAGALTTDAGPGG
jgi:hypothetical protein